MLWKYNGKLPHYLLFLGLKYRGKLPWFYKSDTMGQCYKTFNHGKLLSFCIIYCGNIALKHRMVKVPWNVSKLPQ